MKKITERAFTTFIAGFQFFAICLMLNMTHLFSCILPENLLRRIEEGRGRYPGSPVSGLYRGQGEL